MLKQLIDVQKRYFSVMPIESIKQAVKEFNPKSDEFNINEMTPTQIERQKQLVADEIARDENQIDFEAKEKGGYATATHIIDSTISEARNYAAK